MKTTHAGCAELREQLSAWIDAERELAAGTRRHLASCEECRSFVEYARSLTLELQTAPSDDAPAWDALADRIAATQRNERTNWLPKVAAALIGFAGVAAIPRGGSQATSEARLAHAMYVLTERTGASSDAARFANTPAYWLLNRSGPEKSEEAR